MKIRVLQWLWRLAVPGFFASLAITLLLFIFTNTATASAMAGQFLSSMLFSLCIGGILSLVVPPVWGLSANWGVFLRWPARLLLIAGGTALGTIVADFGNWIFWPPQGTFVAFFWRTYFISLILAFSAVFLSVTFETYKAQLQTTRMQLKEKELERERALQLATAAKLSSLESRVHPHFLFNTLNSVASLIHEDPKRAETMVNQLAELLRFSLDSAQGGFVPLEREMKIVEDYLAIEQARFGERLRYTIAVAAEFGASPVPPLAVQTLVENAVKYAVAPRMRGASIHVAAQRTEGMLHLTVTDDGPGFSYSSIPTGHGLHNLEERLDALYGEDGQLRIDSSDAGSSVTLAIPLSVAKAA